MGSGGLIAERPAAELMELIELRFENVDLLHEALTHASYRNEHKEEAADNERLEFLGDAVLGAIISHLLSDTYPEMKEGALTRYKAVLVSEHGLVETAREIDLGQFLLLGRGEARSGGREKDSVIANAMEALVAAVYLDGGFDAAFAFVKRLYGGRIYSVGRTERRVDFKTKLQERVQNQHHSLPAYEIVGWSGPDHDREYEARVTVQDDLVCTGTGRSKKEAEQAAAQVAYETLTSVSQTP